MPTNPYARPITSTATPAAGEVATYRVTTKRPGSITGREYAHTDTHPNVQAIRWDEQYLRLHGPDDEGALPIAMYRHDAVLDLQRVTDEQDDPEQAHPVRDPRWTATVTFSDGTKAEHDRVIVVGVDNGHGPDVVLFAEEARVIARYSADKVDTVEHIDGAHEATTYAPRLAGADASDPGRYIMRQVAP